jgi:hypothetical protein
MRESNDAVSGREARVLLSQIRQVAFIRHIVRGSGSGIQNGFSDQNFDVPWTVGTRHGRINLTVVKRSIGPKRRGIWIS